MAQLSPDERDLAERRINEIKAHIKTFLLGDGPLEDRTAGWERLLQESLSLQEMLDEESWFPPAT